MNTESTYFYIHREGRSIMSSITVSNPYSFNISKNTGFSASVTSELPKKETFIYNQYGSVQIEFKVPAGVKVLKVLYSCYDAYGSTQGELRNYVTNVLWHLSETSSSSADIFYVGVTPGKKYSLYSIVSSASDEGYDEYCSISYSASINQQAPTVTDY